MKRTLFGAALVIGLLSAAPAHADDKDVLIARAKAILDALIKEDYVAASKNFSEEVKASLPQDKLKGIWQDMIGKIGPFKKLHSTSLETRGRAEVVTLTCQFEKDGLDVVVALGEKEVLGLFFQKNYRLAYKAPAYVKAEAFQEVEVVLNPGKWELGATLTLPKGTGPFPAVVLVHGSGPHDRDESIGPNLPFRDLAWGLATKGIAVLRYEKRTKSHGYKVIKENVSLTIKEEVIDDALAAVKLLRGRKEIAPKQIYVLGHSLGANLAPLIGAGDPEVAGLVLLAGNTRPLTDLILEQYDYLLSLNPTDEGKKQVDEIKKMVARLTDPKLDKSLPTEQIMGAPVSYWISLRDYNPTATAAKVKTPMLILQGERDYQVTMKDFDGWKDALKGRENVRFKTYPKLNHLFMEGEGKSTPAEYGKESHISVAVIDDIAEWIKRR